MYDFCLFFSAVYLPVFPSMMGTWRHRVKCNTLCRPPKKTKNKQTRQQHKAAALWPTVFSWGLPTLPRLLCCTLRLRHFVDFLQPKIYTHYWGRCCSMVSKYCSSDSRLFAWHFWTTCRCVYIVRRMSHCTFLCSAPFVWCWGLRGLWSVQRSEAESLTSVKPTIAVSVCVGGAKSTVWAKVWAKSNILPDPRSVIYLLKTLAVAPRFWRL